VDNLLPTIVSDNNVGDIATAELLAKARLLAEASKAASTLKTYESVWATFTAWCSSMSLESWPASPKTVVLYITDRADELKPQTIKKHLAAISQIHKLAGHPSPVQSEPVKLVMQGLRRMKGTASTHKKALRVEHIRKMVAGMPDTNIGIRDKAIILVGFVAGMRRSEVVSLDVADITFEPEGVVVTIRRSKRDQEGRGRQVAVPRGRHEATCPVRALRAWLDLPVVSQGALFVRLDPAGRCQRLAGRAVAHIVQRAAKRGGLDPSMFSGHSLRRGFCTETARAGAAERDIARTTGHSSMAVLRGYVEAGTIFEQCAASALDL
jgi:site-specific recombinase XerD